MPGARDHGRRLWLAAPALYQVRLCEAFGNLARWAAWGKERPNYTGLFAVQWSSNMLDDWLPDFLAAAEYAWNPPDEVPPFEPELARIQAQLARLADAAHPKPEEVDRPAWDAIWLEGKEWGEDIRSGKKKVNAS